MALRFKVMSYNIRYGLADDGEDCWVHRRESLLRLVQEINPDILGVQEALFEQVRELSATLPNHFSYGVGRDDGKESGEYCALFVRHPIVASQTVWISAEPHVAGTIGPGASLPRVISVLDLDLDGETMRVVNTHLDHESQPARELGSKMIDQLDADVVIGDFNCGARDTPISFLVQGGLSLARPEGGALGTYNGFDPTIDGEEIDFVLCSRRLDVVRCWIDRTLRPDGGTPSDHYPVVAELVVKG